MNSKKTALEKLQEQRAQIDARIKAVKARDKQQVRKDDTRRKILIGALAKEHMERFPSGDFAKHMRQILNDHTLRAQDRDLLGLASLPETPASDSHTSANESTRPGEGAGLSMPWQNRKG